jgi:hypothetical protein
MSTKSKNKQMSHAKTASKPGNTKSNYNKKKAPVKKAHGTLLIIVLVIMAIHGIFAAYLYYAMSTAPEVQRPWILGMMVVHSLADIVAAIGIYYWKKWALYVYAGSTILALVAGLISIGAWSTFYMVLPLAIVGWILREKWSYFE